MSAGARDRPLDAGTVLGRSEHVAWVELDEEAVLLDERDGSLHVLNATAAAAWALLDGRRDVAGLEAVLRCAYATNDEVLAVELRRLLQDLADKDLLVRRSR